MPTLVVLVQFVLVVELFRAQCATEFLLFVTALDPLVPQQAVSPLVPLPTTETNVHHVPVVARMVFRFRLMPLVPDAARIRLESRLQAVRQLDLGELI